MMCPEYDNSLAIEINLFMIIIPNYYFFRRYLW